MRTMGYQWNNFETAQEASTRVANTVFSRVVEKKGRTLVFVAHGASTSYAYKALVGTPVPQDSGGMTALSVLGLPVEADVHDNRAWQQFLVNDASHAIHRLSWNVTTNDARKAVQH